MTPQAKKFCDLGDYEFDCKNFKDAYNYYKQAFEIDTEDPYVWYKRSLAAKRINRDDEFFSGIEKSISLSEGKLRSEIKACFHSEKAGDHMGYIYTYYNGAKNFTGNYEEGFKLKFCELCISEIKSLIAIRNQLRLENSSGSIDDEHAINTMNEIYQWLVKIKNFESVFGLAENIWQPTIARTVVPCIDNTAAWLNFKLKEKKYKTIASVFC